MYNILYIRIVYVQQIPVMYGNQSNHSTVNVTNCETGSFWTLASAISLSFLVLVILTNAMIVLVVLRRRSATINVPLFLSLALSDLLMGVFVLPFTTVYAFLGGAVTPGIHCTVSGIAFHVLQTTSLFSFFMISMDRFLSITRPLTYIGLMSDLKSTIIAASFWVLSIALYAVIPISGMGHYSYLCHQNLCNLILNGNAGFYYITSVMLFCISFYFGTYVINFKIFLIARRQQRRVAAMEITSGPVVGRDLKRKVKLVRSILAALGLFTVCWGPYYIAIAHSTLTQTLPHPSVQYCVLWLAISNSSMNFFVLLGTYRMFRVRFLGLVGRSVSENE